MALTLLLAIPLGTLAAWRAGSWIDRGVMVFAVLAVLLFVGGMLFFLWKIIGPIVNPESNTIAVPSLEGKMFDEVYDDYEDIVIVKSEEGVYDDSAPGTIVDQDPPAGRKIAPGETVTVKVSLGELSTVLADYKDMEYRNAEVDLQKKNIPVEF